MKENGGIRPITDCRGPINQSVNVYTGEVFSSFSFVKITDVLSEIADNVRNVHVYG